MATAELLMSIAEFSQLPADGKLRELVHGRVIEMNLPKQRHGEVTINIGGILREFVRKQKLGRVSGSDSGVVTRRNPDSVRGPDVCFFSFDRVRDVPLSDEYAAVAPELVFEILSSTDRLGDVMDKVAEYFAAGVVVVCLADADTETVTILRERSAPLVLHSHEDFTIVDLLPGFRVPVQEFFA